MLLDVNARADVVFVDGTIESITSPRPHAHAVAVQGGRIVAIGTTAEVHEWVGPTTEVVALDGGTLLPGFQDAHVHPISGGLLANRCDLHDLPDAPAYLDAVQRWARIHPER